MEPPIFGLYGETIRKAMTKKNIPRRQVLNLIGSATAITTSAGTVVAEEQDDSNNPYGLDSKHNIKKDISVINNTDERLEFSVEVKDRESDVTEYTRSHKLHGILEEKGRPQNSSKDIQINGLQGAEGVKTLEVTTSGGHSTELNIYMDKFGIPSYMHVITRLMPDGDFQANFSVA